MSKNAKILGQKITLGNCTELTDKVLELNKADKSGYICFLNVNSFVESEKTDGYKEVLNSSLLNMADGVSVIYLSKLIGIRKIERCAGPDIMEMILDKTQGSSYSHFFYGCTNETLDKLEINLKKKYKEINIVGKYAPPFRPLTDEEDGFVVDIINKLAPDYIWIGLGAPKQDFWMYQHKELFSKGIMLGVGAAFDFFAGNTKRAPKLIQKMGLEWFHRLCKSPKRLWKRYTVYNAIFIYYLIKSFFKNGNFK